MHLPETLTSHARALTHQARDHAAWLSTQAAEAVERAKTTGREGLRRARDAATQAQRRSLALKRDLTNAATDLRLTTIERLRTARRTTLDNLDAFRAASARRRIEQAWPTRRPGRPHRLPGRLLVSLTSYPPRFPTLALTLQSLLLQQVEPNAVMLWIARQDMKDLPQDVRDLAREDFRLQILPTEDLGPHKKFAPARARFPTAFIVTADDDVYYPPTWLHELTSGYRPGRTEIPCTRAHLIRTDAEGRPRSYADWSHNIAAGAASPRVFPTGVGGVLYPPRSLDPMAADAAQIRALCPTCDDVWLYWMARRAGWTFRKVGPRREPICWTGTQTVALHWGNGARAGGNDVQIARLADQFGPAWQPDFALRSLGPHHSLRLQRA